MHADRLLKKRVRRHLHLEERAPALINLPLPIPSIPILNPIITPLIAGTPLSALQLPTLLPQLSPTTSE
ncbi:hypothetical protein NM688_g9221 [Phlebia brevispora]|uniref:Uncharacterized protein n=1 Tax=Phlebia brevispora TaxID=194682 RepID=A0ACC1RKP1_9APHY|nr:hypothetical protein NM688_g9221 [Phlebia brevispora]